MREVDFAKQKTEGENALPQSRLAPCQPPRQRGPFREALGTISGSIWYTISTKERNLYAQNSIRLPWQHPAEFQKVLVPLRKFAFQNYIYQRFTNETGEPNLQK